MKCLALALLLAASTASADLGDSLILGASGADIITTEMALRRGGYEANPLMREPGVRVLSKLAAGVIVVWAHRKLKRDGHSTKAKLVVIIAVVLWGGAAVWNVRAMSR